MSKSIDMRKETLILLALNDGPKHGYEIARFLSDSSNDVFSLSFGSLYPILHKLEKNGLVRATWGAGESGKNKKTYNLTAKGKKQRNEEIEGLKTFVSALSNLSGVRI